MLLLEEHAKRLLAVWGVPIPPGQLVARAEALPAGPGPFVVKAQVASGGRGKAGLIRFAGSREAAAARVAELLGRSIHGRKVHGCRVEARISGTECYAGFIVDPKARGVRVLLSAAGGIDIEEAEPWQVVSAVAAPEEKAMLAAIDSLAASLPPALVAAARRLVPAFLELDATLLEINPLFMLAGGGWVAGDARLAIDDNAIERQAAIGALVRKNPEIYPEPARKLASGFDYVEIDPEGDIGLITTGAGLSMMIVDELIARGARPLDFCDIRTGQMRSDPRRFVEVLGWMAERPSVRVLLLSVFAGITDLAEVALLLLKARALLPAFRPPLIARLTGNNLVRAEQILREGDPTIVLEQDLDRALDHTVALARQVAHA